MPRAVVVDESITIPGRELRVSHARSAGPGGQNVNKVNSKAVVRWKVGASAALPPAVKQRFLAKYANRINAEGDVVLAADEHREQGRNLEACLERLRQMAASVAKPPRRRVKTKPSRSSVEERLKSKQRASARKQSRGYRASRDE